MLVSWGEVLFTKIAFVFHGLQWEIQLWGALHCCKPLDVVNKPVEIRTLKIPCLWSSVFRNNIPPARICSHFFSSVVRFRAATVMNDFTKAFVQLKHRPRLKKKTKKKQKTASFPLLGSISRCCRCLAPPLRIWGPSISQEEKEKPVHSSSSLHPSLWPSDLLHSWLSLYHIMG